MHAEIVSIGTEILMGEIVDTNSGYLAAELAKIGIDVRWVTKVGDDPERLHEVIERGWNRSDVTITTGGLGPTSDDLTRESIARVMGEEMIVQDDLLANLKSQFEGRGVPMPATNIKQATLIESAEVVLNPMGTAPGWWVNRGDRVIIAMPGPPRELSRMWDNELAPKLRSMNPEVAIVTRTLKTFGISEGGLDEMLSPLFKSENPSLGIYSKQDGIHLRAIATATTEVEAREMITPMEQEIRRIAGHAIWGLDDETAVTRAIDALKQAEKTLGIIEGFTAGLLTSSLNEAQGYSDVLAGSLVASNPAGLQRFGMPQEVSDDWNSPTPATAETLARTAQKFFDSQVGVGITGLVAEATEASGRVGTAHMAFAVGDQVTSRSGSYPTQRLRIRSRAVTHALLELMAALNPSN
ncbi:MAG: CinA family nicotinamide mononucleotide deamidase-related protein [SAR202 cluster bacterium]|nr:CinA family nicotinamide mononucleotide deamidase-related protein [SAR202 cluster bacterium]